MVSNGLMQAVDNIVYDEREEFSDDNDDTKKSRKALQKDKD